MPRIAHNPGEHDNEPITPFHQPDGALMILLS